MIRVSSVMENRHRICETLCNNQNSDHGRHLRHSVHHDGPKEYLITKRSKHCFSRLEGNRFRVAERRIIKPKAGKRESLVETWYVHSLKRTADGGENFKPPHQQKEQTKREGRWILKMFPKVATRINGRLITRTKLGWQGTRAVSVAVPANRGNH